MRYIIIILILIVSCTNPKSKKEVKFSSEIRKIETISGDMVFADLNNKSSSFIRYSRNQYFAKNGYVFKDSNLALFFQNQIWYKPKEYSKSMIDSSLFWIVDSLKRLEELYGDVEYRKIIHKFNFNGFPLFYIGSNPQIINNEPNEFFDAGFALLDKSMQWTLNCSTIPPEYLIDNSLKYIELIDDSYYLRLEQIEFRNIDEGCVDGELEEIIIHLEGPSDDYNDVILGFNESNEFTTLFDEFITINHISKTSDSTLMFYTTERCDIIGTMFCTRKYQYNTRTKENIRKPYEFDKVEINSSVRDTVKLYSYSRDTVIKVLFPDEKVVITKFIDKKNGFHITSDSVEGWIDKSELYNFNVCFAD